jgi:hypothetical protein
VALLKRAINIGENTMNDQLFEMDETDNEDELLAFDQEGEAGDFEAEGEAQDDRETELAAEMLSVSDEQELDEFFSKLLRGARGVLGSPAGQKLKDLLRKTARTALPLAGQAVGGYFGGDRGAAFGGKVAAAGGQLFGLELEGLSGEDTEMQVARRFVRFAGDAAQRLSASGSNGKPYQAAKDAFLAAARRHAPGIISRISGGTSTAATAGSSRTEGRWIRRGRKILVLGI